jgi:hypothetical protein
LDPVVIQPERRTSTTASISKSPMAGLEKGRKVDLIDCFPHKGHFALPTVAVSAASLRRRIKSGPYHDKMKKE